MMTTESIPDNGLDLDLAAEVARISDRLRQLLSHDLKRRGLVVGLSGGIDSSVTAALAVRALGKDRVFALLMPERHSSADTLPLSRRVAETLGIDYSVHDITPILEAVGFYQLYDDAVRSVTPEFTTGWTSKITIEGLAAGAGFTSFVLVTQSPEGRTIRQRIPVKPYLAIVAATNFKQRIRKMLEYYHADRLNFAVAGTPNRLEYDQGFFVKNGDGSADVKPIAHLYKTQVYRMAEFLGVPRDICERPPTTDTYSMAQGQDEFYFAVPYQQMDICLYGKNHGWDAAAVAGATGLTLDRVRHIWADIDRKRSTTSYLHLPPLLVGDVREIKANSGLPS
jgi:NAD+ synthase